MSITYTADVFCDGEGCSQWEHGISVSYTTSLARHARKAAKKQRWGRVMAPNGKLLDLCPLCMKKWGAGHHEVQRAVQSQELPSSEGAEQAPRRIQDYARLR
jgi:hypothetical protein